MRYFLIILLFFAIITFAQSDIYADGEVLVEISIGEIAEPLIDSNGDARTGWSALDEVCAEIGVFKLNRIIPIAPNPEYRRNWAFTERWFKLIFDPAFDASIVADRLANTTGIVRAEPNWLFAADFTPNDHYYDEQWHLPKIRADLVWDYTQGDSGIIMSGVDSGVDYLHPDLTELIWQNIGEDVDGDGHVFIPGVGIDSSDIDGIDNDGNGYIDDFIGYDWVDDEWSSCYRHPTDPSLNGDCYLPDNDPNDIIFNGHGTHTNGTMLAVSNNSYGGAGVNWRGELMCLRAGYFDRYYGGYIKNEAVIQAIPYGVNKGCRIFNLSYGSYSRKYLDFDTTATRYFLMEVIDTAVHAHGCIITASAGNDNVDTTIFDPTAPADTARYHYPSTFPSLICVANVGPDDCKSWSSNYDSTVDISAPGADILAPVPVGADSAPGDPNPPDPALPEWYGTKGGTSMSAPIVAGAAALLWSFFPDSSNYWIRSRLEDYAENIYGLSCNEEYATNERLGSGRVDIYRALGAGIFPQVELDTLVWSDSGGDGRPDPGEDVSIVLTYSNTDDPIWAASTGAEIVLSSADSLVIVTDSLGYIGDIATGGTASNTTDPVAFQMNPAFDYGRNVRFTATFRDGSGYVHSSNFEILIGYPEVLVATFDTVANNLAKVTESMRFGGVPFDSIIIPHETLDLARLEKHRILLLLSGNERAADILPTTLQDDIETWLTDLGGDGRMCVLSGQDLPEAADSAWLADIFGATHVIDSVGFTFGFYIDGVIDDTIGDGFDNANIAFGAGSAGNQRRMGSCSALGDGIPCLFYDFGDLADSTCVVRREATSGYKTVFMEFGIEGFGDSLRATFLQRILEWGGVQYLWDIPEREFARPSAIELLPPFPNPFNSTVNIGFILPQSALATISVHDLRGKLIRRFDIDAHAGPNFLRWDARTENGERIPSGVYLYSVSTQGARLSGKVTFVK